MSSSIYQIMVGDNDSELPKEVKFVCRLLKIRVRNYCHPPAHITDHPMCNIDAIAKSVGFTILPSERIEGINLGGIKHYNLSEMKKLTENFSKKCMISQNRTGRFFSSKLHMNFAEQDVVIKTWDFGFPVQFYHAGYPENIATELLLMNKGELKPYSIEESLRSQNILPKVIGYSVDDNFAIVYDFRAKQSVSDAIPLDEFLWIDRMRVAKELACLVKLIHENKYFIGSISAENLMIDEKNNFKLCAIAGNFLAGPGELPILVKPDPTGFFGSYAVCAPENGLGNVNVSCIKLDTYAFGVLLMELIMKVKNGYGLVSHKVFKAEMLVNSSFGVEEGVGRTITDLVKSCLDHRLERRPDMSFIFGTLEEVYLNSILHPSKKQKLGELSESKCV